MSRNLFHFVVYLLFFNIIYTQQVGLGVSQINVPWKAGHASAYQYPYVIIYGGSTDTANTLSMAGTNDLWIWDIRNGSWYNPTVQVQGGTNMLPQIYIKGTALNSQNQFIFLASNSTANNVIQKLDINSWTWSFPTSNIQNSARAMGYTMMNINNIIYSYGGISVDQNGFPITGSIQNALSLMDANNYQWTTGPNGLGLTDHSTCYMKSLNSLITFGGTQTGNPTDVTDAVNIYNLTSKTWNVQGIQTTIKPGARRLHTANCLDNIMVVYGGGTNQPLDADVWVLNATNYPTMTWQQIKVNNQTNGPNLRMGHSAVLDEKNRFIYIYGGWGVSTTNDTNMYILDTASWSWTRVPTTGYPAGTTPPVDNPSDNNIPNSSKSSNNTSTIVGAVVGSVVGVALIIIALIFFCIKRRRNQQAKQETETAVGELVDTFTNKDNPFTYNPNGHYNMNDDSDDEDQGFYLTPKNNRMSKSFHGTQTSLARISEIGDTDKVYTGILEALDDNGTMAATNGSRDSARNSKILLTGQVPNEIVSQKPNQFSVPAVRQVFQHHVPIEHHQEAVSPISPTTSTHNFNQHDTSVDALRSIKTTGSSMINHTGNSQLNEGRRKDGIPVTHAIVNQQDEEDEENWTFADSLSVNHHYTNEPIQYIIPSSNQLSVANSTQTWDTKDAQQKQTPLISHHQQPQYPSSTINMPTAQTVTPPSTNSSSRNTNESRQVNIYDTMSPLDALASLGQQNTPGSSQSGSSTLHEQNNNNHNNNNEEKFIQLQPFISSLPRKYVIDKTKSPITGPTNNILFATLTSTPVAIKAFGRREAWERECRNLIKLKSNSVVEILEVLTIQDQQNTEDEDGIRYVTVMERLDETLSSFIRQNRNTKNGSIARDILSCLSWCHSNGIAFCDLKPSNVMHRHGEHWKLIDFEASRTIDEECVGVITPRYCPPEVARATTYGLEGANGVVATASVDLWSLGCVIYELETKKALFPTNIKDETILHFISHPSPSTPILNNGLRWNDIKELEIPQLEKHIPNAHTRQLVKTLLSRDPNKRGSALKLLEDPYFSL